MYYQTEITIGVGGMGFLYGLTLLFLLLLPRDLGPRVAGVDAFLVVGRGGWREEPGVSGCG